MRTYIKDAKLSLGDDSRLMVVLEDGIASDYFIQDPDHKTQLERLLSDFACKEIEVSIQVMKENQDFAQSFVDLSKLVQMDIEIEEEDETE